MATVLAPTTRTLGPVGIKYVTRRRGAQILDRQARKYLGMSGAEFARRYRLGEIDDPVRPEVASIAILLPFAER